MPFKPIGEQARWRTILDLYKRSATGSVVTYDAIAEALGLDSEKDRQAIQAAARRAGVEHERQDRRAVEAVRNEGYRVVEPPEHLRLARRHQRKSSRELVRAQSKAMNVDMSQMEPQTRRVFEVIAMSLAAQIDFNNRLDIRQRDLEAAIVDLEDKHERSEEDVSDLRARLERIEQALAKGGAS